MFQIWDSYYAIQGKSRTPMTFVHAACEPVEEPSFPLSWE